VHWINLIILYKVRILQYRPEATRTSEGNGTMSLCLLAFTYFHTRLNFFEWALWAPLEPRTPGHLPRLPPPSLGGPATGRVHVLTWMDWPARTACWPTAISSSSFYLFSKMEKYSWIKQENTEQGEQGSYERLRKPLHAYSLSNLVQWKRRKHTQTLNIKNTTLRTPKKAREIYFLNGSSKWWLVYGQHG